MNEAWAPIKGYGGMYCVSNTGRVKSLARKPGSGINFAWLSDRILKPTNTSRGYPAVRLANGGTSRTTAIHRLVATAFLPNPDGLPQVNHIDGNKENNVVSNLEWCDAKHNLAHAALTGLRSAAFGVRAGNAKLTVKDVLEIRERFAYGESPKSIASSYGVVVSNIYPIVNRVTWKQVA